MALQTELVSVLGAIKRIGDNRVTDGRQMDANLMRHAGRHVNFEQRRAVSVA